jgi:hypothetical protein
VSLNADGATVRLADAAYERMPYRAVNERGVADNGGSTFAEHVANAAA